jgi:hypothetical protein
VTSSVADLLSRLTPDPWRASVGFSPDVESANHRLFNPSSSDDDRTAALSDWLQKHQPCLFGRIAAKNGFLSYCILTEADLTSTDDVIRDKIQAARRTWTRDGYYGMKNGFIILAISERIARATPDATVKELALRLCSLYLLQDIVPDQVFHDQIWLEKPGRDPTTWQWLAGVNYFCAQGDKRWWQDHRIPGGMGFSVNSVGQMVKSGILAQGMLALEDALGAPAEGWDISKVDSLGKALVLAMHTIHSASNAVSGKATELLQIPKDDRGAPVNKCPVTLPAFLADKDHTQYRGRYHTDVTVPSEYFRADVERPAELPEVVLDFSYLFQAGVENPAYTTMGEGRQIRIDETPLAQPLTPTKRVKMEPVSVPIARATRLLDALGPG